MALSPSQQETLDSFRAITEADHQTALDSLQARSWDLESAVTAHFDGTSHVVPEDLPDLNDDEGEGDESERRPMLDNFGIDDADAAYPPMSQGSSGRRRAAAAGAAPVGGALWWLRQAQVVLAIPLGLLWSAATVVLGLLARLLHIRPANGSLRPRNPFATPSSHISRLDARSAAERFVRSLEDTTGAVRWSRRHEPAQSSPSTSASAVDVGSSGEGMRRRAPAGERKALPDFYVGSYDEALRVAKNEARVLMIVITCEEHENHDEFARTTLTDPDLLAVLEQERILVWGGDTRAKDCYQVSKIVQAWRLPMIGFVSLLPPNATSTPRTSSNSQPSMALLSRLESLDSLAPAAICTHLTGTVLPRVSVFLNRQRAAIATREAERRLRQEQDAAVDRAAKADLERVLRKRAEVDQERRDSETRERQKVEAATRAEQAKRLRVNAFRWRAKQRAELGSEGPRDGVHVRVRLGDGRRVMRSFGRDESLERVYAWIECELETDLDRERASLEQSEVDQASSASYKHKYEFGLATMMPRQEVGLGEIVGEWRGANGGLANEQLVVEGLEERRRSMGDAEPSDEEWESEDEMN